MASEIIVGIDEVGVGSVFGPLVIAATANPVAWKLEGVRDSKTIKSERVRQTLAGEIRHNMLFASVMVSAADVDRQRVDIALKQSIRTLIDSFVPVVRAAIPNASIKVVIDGDGERWNQAGASVVSIARADATVFEVSAASVLAKVICDDWITDRCNSNPGLDVYGLRQCKGYGTEAHIQAILRHGCSSDHRQTFCANMISRAKARDAKRRYPTAGAA